jgi:lanosterol synthase
MDASYWKYWEVVNENGRQYWEFKAPDFLKNNDGIDWESAEAKKFLEELSSAFIYNKQANPNASDKVYRSIRLSENYRSADPQENASKGNNVFSVLYKACNFYQALQTKDGNWSGDYGGPLFLLPGLIIASYITETPFDPPVKILIKRYMLNMQNEDGGWGLHIEGKSTMFGTVMQYVSLFLLGEDRNSEAMTKARTWIKDNGGATSIPSWGKFYLSVLNVYEWKGNNSILPELWLLPASSPIHPSKYWCHTRMVYLPMTYCYGHKITCALTPLTKQLREDIYTEPYEEINWSAARDSCNDADVYAAPSPLLKAVNPVLNAYEKNKNPRWRKKALDFILEYINAEDEQTHYINIGPVSKAINMIAIWHAYGKDSVQFKKHTERIKDYLWLAEDGMKMNGYNGSQLWDTVFAVKAFLEGGMENYFEKCVTNGYNFIDSMQLKYEVRDHQKFFRHASVGGWPFSTKDHSWPITDCTAEGLMVALEIFNKKNKNIPSSIDEERMKQAADLILSFQNKNGGWASYELTRGKKWLEHFNPAAVFEDIMIDYPYVECTSSCVQALTKFYRTFPHYQSKLVKESIDKGLDFILNNQREDGSWLGSWAVCFTYGTWFATEALAANREHPLYKDKIAMALEKASTFLVSHQNGDGGWGESFESCVQKMYIPAANSQVVNTSWALLSLMNADCQDTHIIEKGISLLSARQKENGDWEQENISGVFNFNCMITYTSYRNVFPIWALGKYYKLNKN